MSREPDWETLSEINFLMSRRLLDQLNAARTALEQINDQEPHRGRAESAVQSAQDLYTAWVDLIRHKSGESPLVPPQGRFSGRGLLEWVTTALQMTDLPQSTEELELRGSRPAIQEALLLLQSCAHTLGPGVRVRVEMHRRGLWFRVRYAKVSEPSQNLDELLASLRANWRLQSAAFELRSARDFLAMSNCELFYTVHDHECELSFFVWFAQQPSSEPGSKEKAKALLDSFNTDDTYQVITPK